MDDAALHRDEAVARDRISRKDERELARPSVGCSFPQGGRGPDRDTVHGGDCPRRGGPQHELDRTTLARSRVVAGRLVLDVRAVEVKLLATAPCVRGISRCRSGIPRCRSRSRRILCVRARAGCMWRGDATGRSRLVCTNVGAGGRIALGASKRSAGQNRAEEQPSKCRRTDARHCSRRLPRVRQVSGHPDSASGQPDSVSGQPDSVTAHSGRNADFAIGTVIAVCRAR